ncbi:hypothetical protein [Campylobacter sp. 7477a]|uniref:hypothetical protein n=1 Tax=Campylobacter sp. 7477a TaxID=2735741 RepID=UPI003014AD78|nr:hypothetical protein [Campylobacter sp. 7477a]
MRKILVFLTLFMAFNLVAGEQMQIILKNKNGEFRAVLGDIDKVAIDGEVTIELVK